MRVVAKPHKVSITIQFKKRKVIFDKLLTKNYHTYLDSEEWKDKRKEVIQRAEGCCENCGDYLANKGEVHHNDYDNIFEEDLDDLTYVCRECHP